MHVDVAPGLGRAGRAHDLARARDGRAVNCGMGAPEAVVDDTGDVGRGDAGAQAVGKRLRARRRRARAAPALALEHLHAALARQGARRGGTRRSILREVWGHGSRALRGPPLVRRHRPRTTLGGADGTAGLARTSSGNGRGAHGLPDRDRGRLRNAGLSVALRGPRRALQLGRHLLLRALLGLALGRRSSRREYLRAHAHALEPLVGIGQRRLLGLNARGHEIARIAQRLKIDVVGEASLAKRTLELLFLRFVTVLEVRLH